MTPTFTAAAILLATTTPSALPIESPSVTAAIAAAPTVGSSTAMSSDQTNRLVAHATLITALGTLWLGLSTRRYAAAAEAPCVFVEAINVWKRPDEVSPTSLQIEVKFKNGGPGPAVRAYCSTVSFFKFEAAKKLESDWKAPIYLGPGQPVFNTVVIDGPAFRLIAERKSILRLLAQCKYRGIGKRKYIRYRQCFEYSWDDNRFGATDEQDDRSPGNA